MNKIDILKSLQRKESIKKRKLIFDLKNDSVAMNLFHNFKNSILFKKSKIIGSYYSIKDEFETSYINNQIINFNKTLCLPVMQSNSSPLIYRMINKKTKMIKKKYGIFEPNFDSKEVSPDLIFVPCLAYDRSGYRLGYGGGYFDRTIKKLKYNNPKIITIILAFNEQKVQKIIYNDFDQKLDYILTEKELFKV